MIDDTPPPVPASSGAIAPRNTQAPLPAGDAPFSRRVPDDPNVRGAAAPDDESLDPLELLRILRRRWPWALATLLLVVGGAAVLYDRQVPLYRATTTLRFDVPKTTQIPGFGVEGLTDKNDLATEIVSLGSFSLARDVAEAVRFDVLISKPEGLSRTTVLDELDVAPTVVTGSWQFAATVGKSDDSVVVTTPAGTTYHVRRGERVSIDGFTFRLSAGDWGVPGFTVTVRSLERAAAALQNAVQVTRPNRDAAVLDISFTSPDIGLTKLVPDVVARRFIDRQTRRRQSGGVSTTQFIDEQLDAIEAQLAAAEARLRDWRERNQVVRPMMEAETTVEQRAQYERDLGRTREEIATLESLLEGTREMPATVRDLPGYRRVLSSPILTQSQAGSSILASILRLEGQRADLLGQVTERDPQVQLLDRTLADYERQGEQFVQNYINTRRAEAAAYQRLLGTVGRLLAEVPARELELKTYERDVEVLSSLQLVLQQRLKESEITNASELPSVEVLDAARMPNGPVSPVASRFLLLGLALGVVTGSGAAFVRDALDETLHTVADLERATGAAMVGLIPSFATRQQGRRPRRRSTGGRTETAIVAGSNAPRELITLREPRHIASEAYRTLRANLRMGQSLPTVRVLAVASPSPTDGKSTTTANLAVALALQGERVLVIDADLRRGQTHALFGLKRGHGIAELLADDTPLDGRGEPAVQTFLLPDGGAIAVLQAGRSPQNPTELLGGARWGELMAWARERYDTVLVDTPPVNMFADALVCMAHVDGCVLVARAGKSRSDEVQVAATQLRSLRIPLLGAVLNDFVVDRDGRYGNYRYYRQYYSRYYQYYSSSPDAASA
jgi:polysaccharide biosynthesis transport protein